MSDSTVADRVEILELLSRHQIYIDLKDADGYAGPPGRQHPCLQRAAAAHAPSPGARR